MMPTLAPTPIPAPQPTQARPLAATAAATSTPLPPTPTPHPCDLVAIPSLAEMQLVYTRFMAADPYANSVNTEFRKVLAGLFPDIAAAYILEFIHDPLRYASFRDYLGRKGFGAAHIDRGAYFQQVRQSSVLPRVDVSYDASLYEYIVEPSVESGPCNWARMKVFVDDELIDAAGAGIISNFPWFPGSHGQYHYAKNPCVQRPRPSYAADLSDYGNGRFGQLAEGFADGLRQAP